MKKLLISLIALLAMSGMSFGQLLVDFNSTTQDGGPHNHPGFNAYDAGHEVAADFVTQSYSAFGASVGITPDWPNTTNNFVRQMIDRSVANDATWTDVADLANGNIGIDGVTDWLGIDTRTSNGGNGDWDGTTGTPTYMTLALSGLPAGAYDWTSFHHDTENVHGNFSVELSTDGGTTFASLADGYMSDGTEGGSPESAARVNDVAGMVAAGSVYDAQFVANGTDDVVLRFAPHSGALAPAVHNQLWGINGFQLGEVANAAVVWDAVDVDTTAGDLIGGPKIDFVAATYPGGGNAGGTPEGDTTGTFFTGAGGDTGNADLNEVLNSHGWKGGNAGTVQVITLDGLQAGEEYRIQVLSAGDTRACCNTRTQSVDDLVGNVSGSMTRGNESVIGTFTATSSVQNIAIGGDKDPGSSGYILTQVTGARGTGEVLVEALNYGFPVEAAGIVTTTVTVPEPSSAALLVLACTGMLMGRRRRS